MTRLNSTDIINIGSRLEQYDQELIAATGCDMLGIACHAYSLDEKKIARRIGGLSVAVVPVTTGEGIITGFSETVAEILNHLGFSTTVTPLPDVGGIAYAYSTGADLLFMSDDDHYVGINVHRKIFAHNTEATGRVYAAVLDLLAKATPSPNTRRNALVLGCGPVGRAASSALLDFGFTLTLFDTNRTAAEQLRKHLCKEQSDCAMSLTGDLESTFINNNFILEATPSPDSIPDRFIQAGMAISAPGVPSSLTPYCLDILGNRAIHDKLELGTAAMAVQLLSDDLNGLSPNTFFKHS